MKKLRLAGVTLLMGVLLFALTACGGATSTLSSFVSAVKNGNYEKASEYCLDASAVKALGNSDAVELDKDWEKLGEKMEKKVLGKFSYKVTETTEDSEGKTTKLSVSYTAVDMTKLTLAIASKLGLDALNPKVDEYEKAFDEAWKDVATKDGTITVILNKNDDGDWKIVSGATFIGIMAVGGVL